MIRDFLLFALLFPLLAHAQQWHPSRLPYDSSGLTQGGYSLRIQNGPTCYVSRFSHDDSEPLLRNAVVFQIIEGDKLDHAVIEADTGSFIAIALFRITRRGNILRAGTPRFRNPCEIHLAQIPDTRLREPLLKLQARANRGETLDQLFGGSVNFY